MAGKEGDKEVLGKIIETVFMLSLTIFFLEEASLKCVLRYKLAFEVRHNQEPLSQGTTAP